MFFFSHLYTYIVNLLLTYVADYGRLNIEEQHMYRYLEFYFLISHAKYVIPLGTKPLLNHQYTTVQKVSNNNIMLNSKFLIGSQSL